jgi:hypothetical protein
MGLTREARMFNQNLPIETTYGYKTIIRHWKCMLPKCGYEANSLRELKEHKHEKHAY